jgi:hypothetical protein
MGQVLHGCATTTERDESLAGAMGDWRPARRSTKRCHSPKSGPCCLRACPAGILDAGAGTGRTIPFYHAVRASQALI